LTPDAHLLAEIAQGQNASAVLETYEGVLDGLIETSLKAVDQRIEARSLSPEQAYGLLHEICSYRRIKQRLRQKVDQGTNAQAACAEPTEARDVRALRNTE
jgi:hypothetical protein